MAMPTGGFPERQHISWILKIRKAFPKQKTGNGVLASWNRKCKRTEV